MANTITQSIVPYIIDVEVDEKTLLSTWRNMDVLDAMQCEMGWLDNSGICFSHAEKKSFGYRIRLRIDEKLLLDTIHNEVDPGISSIEDAIRNEMRWVEESGISYISSRKDVQAA